MWSNASAVYPGVWDGYKTRVINARSRVNSRVTSRVTLKVTLGVSRRIDESENAEYEGSRKYKAEMRNESRLKAE